MLFPQSMHPSNLTRAQITIFSVSAIVLLVSLGSVSYYRYLTSTPTVPGPGLHRSNAVRRRRRSRSHFDEEPDENVDTSTVRPLADGETVVEDVQIDEWWEDPANIPTQRAGQNIVSLLFRVSEDNARRNACVHRGCACNACGTVPIRGIRYRCANCADFDLCEACESQGLHNKTHIFYKVKVPAPPFGPRQMQPVWYPGDPDQCLRSLPRSLMAKLSKETGFERPELEAFWEQWTFMANTEWRDDPDELCLAMDRKTFERCLAPSGGYKHAAPNLIHDRMFAFYDTNHDDLIGFTEFLHGLSYRKRKDKLRKIFDGYDIDADGFISRKDCLRMFRAYYVLYKQMHRDILEGLDDQVMSSTEAQQLVTGRAPLSSLFGREGRVPAGEPGRHVEGKTYRRNGDVQLTDGRNRAVGEDTQDTAPRNEILSSLFSREPHHVNVMRIELASRGRRDQNQLYWDSLLNPPRNVEELGNLLNGEPRQLLQNFLRDHLPRNNDDDTSSRSSDAENREVREQNADTENGDGSSTGASNHRRIDPSQRANRVPTAEELLAQAHYSNVVQTRTEDERKRQVQTRRHLHERWKRRQFYLDMEEGGQPPEGWESDEDVMNNDDAGVGESSKSAQRPPLSPRSRSSSKVRFVEDTDDYEIRSNPSTSSRSVPERWGGFDIPEAERDAGKEILYQVTQQAFNELLDVIFKEKEDLAIKAAESKEERRKWRYLFDRIDLKEEERKEAEREHGDNRDRQRRDRTVALATRNRVQQHRRSRSMDPFIDDQRAGEERASGGSLQDIGYRARRPEDRSLDDLLHETGYSLHQSSDGEEVDGAAEDKVEETEAHADIDITQPKVEPVPQDTSLDQEESESEDEERDLTLPQFRPNGVSDTPTDVRLQARFAEEAEVVSGDDSSRETVPIAAPPADAAESPVLPNPATPVTSAPPPGKGKGKKKASPTTPPVPPPWAVLVRYKRLDEAEKEAVDRGGWGRLSYEEFGAIYKRQESEGNRLDYLGSWIDFCIP